MSLIPVEFRKGMTCLKNQCVPIAHVVTVKEFKFFGKLRALVLVKGPPQPEPIYLSLQLISG